MFDKFKTTTQNMFFCEYVVEQLETGMIKYFQVAFIRYHDDIECISSFARSSIYFLARVYEKRLKSMKKLLLFKFCIE